MTKPDRYSPPAGSDTIYRSETIEVRRVPAERPGRWVITFDNYEIGPGFDRPGFGENFLLKYGLSAIHVMGRGDDWYQYPDILDACAAVREATAGARRRIAYGSSMGGYAALRLADAIGADAVLALSPQYSIDPRVTPWENRWLQDSNRLEWQEQLGGEIKCACTPVVVYDPTNLDAAHARLIAADTPSILFPVHHCGHPVGPPLNEMELLRRILRSVINNRFDPAVYAEQVRQRRGQSATYLSTLAEAQPTWRPRTAEAIARRTITAPNGNALGSLALARILARSGDRARALELFAQMATPGRHYTFSIAYADCLVADGQPGAAAPVAANVIAIVPNMAHLRHWYAWVLAEAGDYPAAIEQEQTALALSPGTALYSNTLARYHTLAARSPSTDAIARLFKGARKRVSEILGQPARR